MIRKTLAALLFLLAANISVQAQEATYPDYNALRDTLGNRMMAFYMQHQELDMKGREEELKKDLGNKDVISKLSFAKPRKKTLTAKQIYPLCKPSTLVVCQVDYRPHTNDFYLDIFATAVALTEDGVCASNHHVFEDISKMASTRHFIRFVADMDGNIYPLKSILLTDSLNDYCVFAVDVMKGKLTPMPIGEPAVEGEDVYCLSHPKSNMFYMTRGMVARNQSLNEGGKTKLEMQITADYAICSSGGPIIDDRGNLVGLVGSTNSLYANADKIHNFQMSIKKAVPIKAILDGLRRYGW